VRAEATGDLAEAQFVPLRNELVGRGLGFLRSVTVDAAHVLGFPGIDAGQLLRGQEFTVAGAVTGRAGPGDDTTASLRFVVHWPEARDLSDLAGLAPGTLIFPPGARFRVAGDRIAGERRTLS
jgi:hypothetical protein